MHQAAYAYIWLHNACMRGTVQMPQGSGSAILHAGHREAPFSCNVDHSSLALIDTTLLEQPSNTTTTPSSTGTHHIAINSCFWGRSLSVLIVRWGARAMVYMQGPGLPAGLYHEATMMPRGLHVHTTGRKRYLGDSGRYRKADMKQAVEGPAHRAAKRRHGAPIRPAGKGGRPGGQHYSALSHRGGEKAEQQTRGHIQM